MNFVVYSQSKSFLRHIKEALKDLNITYSNRLKKIKAQEICLIHTDSFSQVVLSEYFEQSKKVIDRLVVAEEQPNVEKMLYYTHLGIRGYCNAYMANVHYQQLAQLMAAGQSWYPPHLLVQALNLAHTSINQNINQTSIEERLKLLTPREKQIALSVAEGKSNKLIANEYGITERTVKAHLTHIFEKLPVKDRVSLVVYIKNIE